MHARYNNCFRSFSHKHNYSACLFSFYKRHLTVSNRNIWNKKSIQYKQYYHSYNQFCTLKKSSNKENKQLPGRPSFMDDNLLDEEIEIIEVKDDTIKKTKHADPRIWNPEWDESEVNPDKYEIEYITDDEDNNNNNNNNETMNNDNKNDNNDNNNHKDDEYDDDPEAGLAPKREKRQHRVVKSSVRQDIVVEFENISGLERIYSWIVVLLAFYCGRLIVRYAYLYGEKFELIEPIDPAMLKQNQINNNENDDDTDDINDINDSQSTLLSNQGTNSNSKQDDEDDW